MFQVGTKINIKCSQNDKYMQKNTQTDTDKHTHTHTHTPAGVISRETSADESAVAVDTEAITSGH